MENDENAKIELPVAPSLETMKLLIKAKHFLEHAKQHAQKENGFDIMISIHSLDNTIEYLLRIIIKHLEIEQITGKTLSTPELMSLFGEIDKFLTDYASFEGRGIRLPYKNEITLLRGLRNNVQHGMVLPVGELQDFIKYGEKFFEKILSKIFGLTVNEISYSTLVQNDDVKKLLIQAETKINEGFYLEAIVACRDAFELGQFMLQNRSYHLNKMAAIPHVKSQSMEFYYYIQSLDEKISIIGTNINASDYRTYSRYVDHIPNEYNANKAGYSVMQRAWEKKDAEFCYSFVSQTILLWELTQEKPLYEVDESPYQGREDEFSINGVLIPEIYYDKSCRYLNDGAEGYLFFVNDENIKKHIKKINADDICLFNNKIINDKVVISEYSEYVRIIDREINIVLNKGPLWEIFLYYKIIPFTTKSKQTTGVDIDNICDYIPRNEEEKKGREITLAFGMIDSIDKAFELYEKLYSEDLYSFMNLGLYSSNLIMLIENKNA